MWSKPLRRAVAGQAAEQAAGQAAEQAAEQAAGTENPSLAAEQAAEQAAGAENPSLAAEQAAGQAAGQVDGTENPTPEQLDTFKQLLEQAAKDKNIKDKEIAALTAQTGKENFVKHLQAQIWLYSALLIFFSSTGPRTSMHDMTDSS